MMRLIIYNFWNKLGTRQISSKKNSFLEILKILRDNLQGIFSNFIFKIKLNAFFL